MKLKLELNMKPKLTKEVLRDATLLAETGQPGLASDLLDRYHGTTVLRRHLLDMHTFKMEAKEATESMNVASLEFEKAVKNRRKRMGENEGKQ